MKNSIVVLLLAGCTLPRHAKEQDDVARIYQTLDRFRGEENEMREALRGKQMDRARLSFQRLRRLDEDLQKAGLEDEVLAAERRLQEALEGDRSEEALGAWEEYLRVRSDARRRRAIPAMEPAEMKAERVAQGLRLFGAGYWTLFDSSLEIDRSGGFGVGLGYGINVFEYRRIETTDLLTGGDATLDYFLFGAGSESPLFRSSPGGAGLVIRGGVGAVRIESDGPEGDSDVAPAVTYRFGVGNWLTPWFRFEFGFSGEYLYTDFNHRDRNGQANAGAFLTFEIPLHRPDDQ